MSGQTIDGRRVVVRRSSPGAHYREVSVDGVLAGFVRGHGGNYHAQSARTGVAGFWPDRLSALRWLVNDVSGGAR